jgi:vacuolar-type H+-ATPase subunit E/Vma4
MAGSDELLARIEAEGRDRIAAIDAERDRSVAEIRERASKEVSELERSAAARSRHESEQILERTRSEVRLMERNARLSARWRVIERVMQDAVTHFRSDAGYAERLTALVRRHATTGGTVTAAEPDVPLLAKAGIKAKAGQFTAGAVIATDRGALNFSVEALSAEVRESVVGDIAAVLFPAGRRQ